MTLPLAFEATPLNILIVLGIVAVALWIILVLIGRR